jgi:hypothetical protein
MFSKTGEFASGISNRVAYDRHITSFGLVISIMIFIENLITADKKTININTIMGTDVTPPSNSIRANALGLPFTDIVAAVAPMLLSLKNVKAAVQVSLQTHVNVAKLLMKFTGSLGWKILQSRNAN